LARIRETIAQADWDAAAQVSAALASLPEPNGPELEPHLADLRATLVAARQARADMAVSNARLAAASRFAQASMEFAPDRQEFAGSPTG
jgi:hypothetical protein